MVCRILTDTHWSIALVSEESWTSFRDLRLEMLADSPKAFIETLPSARQQSETDWRRRASKANSDGHCGFVAVDAHGRWIGIMRSTVEDGRLFLLGVYVSPLWRSSGIADALLAHVEEWAKTRGHEALTLEVHEDNLRAQAFYRRQGFEPTGETVPYPLAEGELEVVMTKSLAERSRPTHR